MQSRLAAIHNVLFCVTHRA